MPKRKSGLSANKTHAILRRLEAKVRGHVATAIHHRQTQTELMDRMTLIYHSSEYKRLPQWAHNYLSGMYHGSCDVIVQHLTVYGYDFEGVLHQTGPSQKLGLCDWPLWDVKYHEWNNSDDPNKGTYIEWSKKRIVAQGLYWPDGKPYSVDKSRHYSKAEEPPTTKEQADGNQP